MNSQAGTVANSFGMSSDSLASSQNRKYGDLMSENVVKRLRRDLSNLMSYIFSCTGNLIRIHIVVTIIRLFQIFGPTLSASYNNLWIHDSTVKKAVGFISIFYQLVPNFAPKTAVFGYLAAYCVLQGLFYIILITSSTMFKKTASLSNVFSYFIVLYVDTLGYILLPITSAFIGNYISEWIFLSNEINIGDIVVTVIAFVLLVLYLFFYKQILSNSLQFRPDSLMAVMGLTSFFGLCSPCVTAFISELVSCSSPIIQLIGKIVNVIVFALMGLLPFFKGGLVKPWMNECWTTSCFSGGIMSIIIGIFLMMKEPGSMTIIFILIFLFPIVCVITHIVFSKKKFQYVLFLDSLVENPEYLDSKIPINKIMNIAVAGYQMAHPYCIEHGFLKAVIEIYQRKIDLWYMLAKFIVIYPEDLLNLSWVFHAITIQKMKGPLVRSIKLQIVQIARERESNLSNDLKPKLNLIMRHTTSAKHKLRHVWDLVIQGNISEMENATKRAFKDIEKLDSQFMHLFRQFPNNRFVTRNFSRFSLELKADRNEYQMMSEATRKLHRGISVNADQTNNFGLMAFPNLPTTVSVASEARNLTESMSSNIDLDTENEETIMAQDSAVLLEKQINDLTIPAIRGTVILRLFALFVYYIPIIALMIYLKIYENTLVDPLDYVLTVAKTRELLYQVSPFVFYYIFQSLGAVPAPIVQDQLPTYFGESYDTKTQLDYIISMSQIYSQKISLFKQFNSNDPDIKAAQKLIYDRSFNYSYYFNTTTFDSTPSDLATAVMDMIVQGAGLLSVENINNSILDTSYFLNIQMNTEVLGNVMNTVMSHFNNYIISTYKAHKKVIRIIEYAFIVFSIIFNVALLVIEIVWIQKSKTEAYRCLTALPKNAVQVIAENLRIIKKDNGSATTQDSETSKQEDNILKTFVDGASTNTFDIMDRLLLIFVTIAMIGFMIGSSVILGDAMEFLVRRMKESAPQIDFVNKAYSMLMATMNSVLSILALEQNIPIKSGKNKYEYAEMMSNRIAEARDAYQLVRFGGASADDTPFLAFATIVKSAQSKMVCKDQEAPVKKRIDLFNCYSPPIIQTSIEGFLNSRIRVWLEEHNNGNDYILSAFDDDIYSNIWTILIRPQYDLFLGPMFENVLPTLKDELNKKAVSVIPGLVAMLIVAFVLEMINFVQLQSINLHIKTVLKLLLHCSPDVVLQVNKCAAVLSGDFKNHTLDSAVRDQEFYDDVYMNLTFGAIVLNPNEDTIEKINNCARRLLNRDLEGESIKTIFPQINVAANEKFAINYEDKNLEILPLKLVNRVTIIIRDITQRIRYNTLIQEERKKSDYLLSTILPPSLVVRVQAGEKDISFAVQSATISFIDIVSFTPWCGSLPADRVMMTLNLLFKKFDAIVAKYSTMTKIKCIGDCYMSAGGVFSEINQPSDHARDVVNFGLDALDAIGELNQELGESLQIRVGINTGGPIVAGVLGTEKPTFEILGPAINMAQQMEHHGIAMQVHISRSVYELIYGDMFLIKERGTIEVKDGKVVTYLVSRK